MLQIFHLQAKSEGFFFTFYFVFCLTDTPQTIGNKICILLNLISNKKKPLDVKLHHFVYQNDN